MSFYRDNIILGEAANPGMKKLGIWLLVPAIVMGTWITPVAGMKNRADVAQVVSVGEAPETVAQVEATPVVAEPEAPVPANSDPASTSPAKDSGTTTVGPAYFPNVCDPNVEPVFQNVSFTVQYPADQQKSPLDVRIYAEGGGCIPGIGYIGPTLSFPDKSGSYGPRTVDLPAGRYVYEYSGDEFQSAWGIPFQVTESGQNEVTVKPTAIPTAQTVTLNVTIPVDGSGITIVITDANGWVESVFAEDTGKYTIELPAGSYFYEYTGADYAWFGPKEFAVTEDGLNTIDIAPEKAAITVTPSQAQVGTNVDVHVTGFRENDEYELSFNNGQHVDYGSVNSNGDIITSFKVPEDLALGKYPVVVTGAVSGQRVEATFTVSEAAQLTLSPASAPAGDVVTVSGSGYTPGEQVNIYFDGDTGQRVGYLPADIHGEFVGRITVPSSATMGQHTIVASQDNGPSATSTVTVTQRVVNVSVSSQSVTPGTVVTVSGSGFKSGEIVDIRWDSENGPLLGYRTADSSGSFTGRVTVPTTASAGDHALFAKGRITKATASATIHVTAPQVSVFPTTQTTGKVVSVAGSGFQPNEIVDIRWNGPSGRLLGYVTASNTGTVSGKVTVPAGTVPGDYSIVMIGRTSKATGTANLTVTGATVTVIPAQAAPGTVVAVNGSGFGSGERVNIRWNGPSGRLLGYRTTTSGGAMSGRVTIPADATPGTYTLHLQGQTSGIVGSVTVTVNAAAWAPDHDMVWRPRYDGEGTARTDHARPAR